MKPLDTINLSLTQPSTSPNQKTSYQVVLIMATINMATIYMETIMATIKKVTFKKVAFSVSSQTTAWVQMQWIHRILKVSEWVYWNISESSTQWGGNRLKWADCHVKGKRKSGLALIARYQGLNKSKWTIPPFINLICFRASICKDDTNLSERQDAVDAFTSPMSSKPISVKIRTVNMS